MWHFLPVRTEKSVYRENELLCGFVYLYLQLFPAYETQLFESVLGLKELVTTYSFYFFTKLLSNLTSFTLFLFLWCANDMHINTALVPVRLEFIMSVMFQNSGGLSKLY